MSGKSECVIEPAFDDDVVAASLAECTGRVPPERGEGSPFANARRVSGDALIDHLAAYLGRDVAAWGS